MHEIAILGAASMVGTHVLNMLAERHQTGIALTRKELRDTQLPDGFVWQKLDDTPIHARIIYSLIPLPALTALLPRLECDHLIILGTTSLHVKMHSPDAHERAFAEGLATAENTLRHDSMKRHYTATLLRPTLIWEEGKDKNITAIARFIRRFGFFPIASPARGLRQPIHAADVATAMLLAATTPATANQSFDLPGCDPISYREMVVKIFAGLGRKPCILSFPVPLLRLGFTLLKPVFGDKYSPALINRMNQDLSFNGAPFRELSGFTPRPFAPDFGKKHDS